MRLCVFLTTIFCTLFSLNDSLYCQEEMPCEYSYIYINVSDFIDSKNDYYYKILDPNAIVYSKSSFFDFSDTIARLVPKTIFADTINDFMVEFKMSASKYKEFVALKQSSVLMVLTMTVKKSDVAETEITISPEFKISKNSTFSLGNNIFHHETKTIVFAYPELVTIPAISADIEDKLFGMQFFYEFDSTTNNQADPMQWKFNEVRRPGSHQDSAYVRARNLLNDREFNRKSSVLLSIDQIEDLMKLYLYLKSYVEPNSFFNQEAKNLAASIVVMEYTLRNVENDSLRAALDFSRNVYKKYSSTIDQLNSLFIRTKTVLFQNGILSQSDHKEYFLLEKEPILNSEDEILNHKGSFGAFVIPTRLRFSSPAQFTNDFTIGASTHFPIFKNPTLDLVAGLGLSAIRTDTIGDQKNLKLAAVTTTAGITIAPFGDHFQVGVFVGLDTGNLLEYQKKPWLAIGAAYRLKKPKIKPARPRE